MKPIELLKKHREFNNKYDCYVLLAVSRKKDTPEITNSQEIVFREVIKNENDIIRKYNKIKAFTTNYKDEEGKSFPFYIYVSLNARNALKATFALKNKIDYWIQQTINGVDNSDMFKKLHGHFYSQLMLKESKSSSQRYFMIDYDEKERIESFCEMLRQNDIEYELINETKNGYHIKCLPFDRRKLNDINTKLFPFEVKIDSNFFVEYVTK